MTSFKKLYGLRVIFRFEKDERTKKMAYFYPYRYRGRGYRRNYRSSYRRSAATSYRAPTKRRVTRKKSTTTLARRTASVSHVKPHPFLIANMNPFLPEAFNARVPDSSTAPSSSLTLRDEAQLSSSNTTNLLAAYFPANMMYQYVPATQVNSTTVSWGAAYTSNAVTWTRRVSMASSFNVARPVAHGIRLTSPVAPTAAAGYVHVALYSMSDYNQVTWELPTTVAMMRDLPSYKKFTLASLTQNPQIIVNKFLDQTAFRYVDVDAQEFVNSNSSEFHVPLSWMGILVMVDGHGTTSPCLDFEIIQHTEAQARFGTLLGDSAPEPLNEEVIQATSAAAAEVNQMFREGTSDEVSYTDRFKSCAARSFKNVLYDNAAQAGALIGDMAGRAAVGVAMSGAKALLTDAGIPGVNNPSRLTNG